MSWCNAQRANAGSCAEQVYSILAIQLGFTVLCCGACMYYDPVRTFVVGSGMLCFYAAMIMSFVLIIALFCNKNSYPLNVYLLGCFTFCESWLVGTISALYQEQGMSLPCFRPTVRAVDML